MAFDCTTARRRRTLHESPPKLRTQALLRDTLRPFKAKFPNVAVSLMEGSAADIEHSVAIGDLDIAFVIGANELPLC